MLCHACRGQRIASAAGSVSSPSVSSNSNCQTYVASALLPQWAIWSVKPCLLCTHDTDVLLATEGPLDIVCTISCQCLFLKVPKSYWYSKSGELPPRWGRGTLSPLVIHWIWFLGILGYYWALEYYSTSLQGSWNHKMGNHCFDAGCSNFPKMFLNAKCNQVKRPALRDAQGNMDSSLTS